MSRETPSSLQARAGMDIVSSCRVLHVCDHSWPVLDGYSLRSRNIVAAQAAAGMRPTVLTGPLHQLDDRSASDLMLDGVPYLRTAGADSLAGKAIDGRWPLLREAGVVLLLSRRIQALLDRDQFDVVHAHSPALCGLAALCAARSRGISLVYEIRAFWEDAAVNQNKTGQGSARYWLMRRLESFVVQHADSVVGIARPILDDLGGRGIAAEKLFYVPNGVDTTRFHPAPRDAELAAQLQLGPEPVLGFIGTLFPWEGVTWLVHAAAELRRRGASFQLLIVGDGEDADQVRAAIREVNAGQLVRFVGRVPHEEIQRYYSVIDVLVYPRRSVRLTEMVTPLKPLEAMALGKAVLGSNVGGIRELVENGKTGVLFEPDQLEDFCQLALQLLREEAWRRDLGERARQAVLEERDWQKVIQRYGSVYEFAARKSAARSGIPPQPRKTH